MMLDFYLIVSDYGAAFDKGWLAKANKLIPPNVFPFHHDGLAAKYAVLSEADFHRLNGPETRNVSVWARFAQPARLVWAYDSAARDKAIDGFVNDPDVKIIVCSLTAAGVGINLQVSSNVVLAELSWTNAEQTQAIDRVHRIGQDMPVTAWRILAAQTIDTKIAELIDAKAGLAARALDGAGEAETTTADVQVETLVALLTEALERETSRWG